MLRDVWLFLELFLVVTLAFSLAFCGFSAMDLYEAPAGGGLLAPNLGALSVPFWATFGVFDLSGATWSSAAVLFIACLLTNVLLIK